MPFGDAGQSNAGVEDTHNIRRLVLRNVPDFFGLGVALGRNVGGLRCRRLVVVLVDLGLRVNLRLLVWHLVGMRPALIHQRLVVIVLSLVLIVLLRQLVHIDRGGESRSYSRFQRFFRGFGFDFKGLGINYKVKLRKIYEPRKGIEYSLGGLAFGGRVTSGDILTSSGDGSRFKLVSWLDGDGKSKSSFFRWSLKLGSKFKQTVFEHRERPNLQLFMSVRGARPR